MTAEALRVPEMHPGLVLHINHDVSIGEPADHFSCPLILCFGAEVLRIEVHQVVVLDALRHFEAMSEVPDTLGDAAGAEVPVWKADVSGHGQHPLGDRVLAERVIQVFELSVYPGRFWTIPSHHRMMH